MLAVVDRLDDSRKMNRCLGDRTRDCVVAQAGKDLVETRGRQLLTELGDDVVVVMQALEFVQRRQRFSPMTSGPVDVLGEVLQ